jgi:hypothetical protein
MMNRKDQAALAAIVSQVRAEVMAQTRAGQIREAKLDTLNQVTHAMLTVIGANTPYRPARIKFMVACGVEHLQP